jgi:hypothetical protein
MPPSNGNSNPRRSIQGISDLLIGIRDPLKQRALEDFRIEYEKENGPTDLTKRYTSVFPTDQQDWLLQHHPKRYWDGLPPYFQAYVRKQVESAAVQGNLDKMPDALIQLFVKREMEIGGEELDR